MVVVKSNQMTFNTHLQLPHEVWLDIFSYLSPTALGRVSQTCHLFNRLSQVRPSNTLGFQLFSFFKFCVFYSDAFFLQTLFQTWCFIFNYPFCSDNFRIRVCGRLSLFDNGYHLFLQRLTAKTTSPLFYRETDTGADCLHVIDKVPTYMPKWYERLRGTLHCTFSKP